MAFDLAKAAGLDKIVSNLDTMEVVMIPLDKIDQNEKNFFSVDDVQDLMESIQVNGILQPLNLVRAGDRYRIIAGHRRFKAAGIAGLKEVPAIILPEMSEAMEWFMLIKTNTTTRELSHAEKAEAAIRLKKHLVQMKQEGVKITGRLRDIVAQQMEISPSEVGRMEVINKNLSPEAKTLWKNGNISPSAAYLMALQSRTLQDVILISLPYPITAEAVKGFLSKYVPRSNKCKNKRAQKNSHIRWHKFPEEIPAQFQRVVVRRESNGIVSCGEYVYKDGNWCASGLNDYKMNITNVTHWIEAPEEDSNDGK